METLQFVPVDSGNPNKGVMIEKTGNWSAELAEFSRRLTPEEKIIFAQATCGECEKRIDCGTQYSRKRFSLFSSDIEVWGKNAGKSGCIIFEKGVQMTRSSSFDTRQ